MTPIRVISRLDVKGHNVVKGVHLEGLRVVGQPAEMAKRYYADGADEILFMDVVASLYGRNNLLSVVEETARDVFVPITVGGGIRTLDNIVQALRSGADKVAINTAAIARPDVLSEAALAFGSQCIVLSVEAKRRAPGQWEALTDNGREPTGIDVLQWVQRAQSLGAGEILITSVDREGTRKGFDLELVEAVHRAVRIPVIACGGAGTPADVAAAARVSDAVACASLFHYALTPLPGLKKALADQAIEVRL